MDNIKAVLQNKVSRRKFISGVSAGVGVTAAATLAAGCGNSSPAATTPTPAPTPAPTVQTYTNVDILNFALNLEYLEAEFYLRAVTGNGLAPADIGTAPGTVNGGTKVSFQTPAYQQYAVEVAGHEQLHVQFLRKTITAIGGTPVDRPQIEFTNAFTAAAVAAKIPGGAFNPFDNENDFILGSFLFEDVGVTAYNGAAALIVNDANYAAVLSGAGGIVAIEAYHAGLLRYLVNDLGASAITTANLISDLRGAASASVTGTTSGAAETHVSSSSLVAADSMNSLAYTRNASQILHIVYLNATAGVVSKGGFFPNGLNGNITTSLS